MFSKPILRDGILWVLSRSSALIKEKPAKKPGFDYNCKCTCGTICGVSETDSAYEKTDLFQNAMILQAKAAMITGEQEDVI